MADRDLAGEIASPKYAYIERERRWLVPGVGHPSLHCCRSIRIEDLYIAGTLMRLRLMASDGGWTSRKLTKKYAAGTPDARPIVTTYLDEHEFSLLVGLSGHTITKRRYTVTEKQAEFSLDVFEGNLAGLKILEIEGQDAKTLASVVPPCWAGSEITHQPDWQGGALSRLDHLPEKPWPAS